MLNIDMWSLLPPTDLGDDMKSYGSPKVFLF